MPELITVIVPVYNMQSYVSKCIHSILVQDYTNLEILLIDDGSTDQSPYICDEYAKQDPRVRVLHQANCGLACSRNIGIAQAQGEYLFFADADDWLEPDCIAVLKRLSDDNDASIAAGNHFIVTSRKTTTRFPASGTVIKLNTEQALQNVLYHDIPDVSAWGKLYRREVFRSLRYPAGKLYEDTFLIAEVLKEAGSLVYTAKPLYHYLLRDDSISRGSHSPLKMDFLAAVEHFTQIVRSQYPYMQAGCIRRNVHAALSVRRYFVDCEEANKPLRDNLEKRVRKQAGSVLYDRRAPMRDKAAVLAVCCGSGFYDMFWKLYSKWRQVV